MDYKAFFNEIADWIYQCNQMAMKYGMNSENFWQWVATSLGELANKYGNNPLVKNQIAMLYGWLDEVYQGTKEKKR